MGEIDLATAKRARTIFSPSPTHFEVKVEALMLKNVDFDWLAMHLPTITGIDIRFTEFSHIYSITNRLVFSLCPVVQIAVYLN